MSPISEPVGVVDEAGATVGWRYEGAGADGGDVVFPVVCLGDASKRSVLADRCFDGDFAKLGADARFGALDAFAPEVMRTVRGYVANFRQAAAERHGGLILFGLPGRGKTTLAAAICNELMDKGVACKMTTLKALDDAAVARYGETGRIVAGLARFDLVVLDDFAPSTANPQRVERVFSIVDGLEKRRVPVIVTTNLTAAQLANPDPSRNDVRVFDRIKGQAAALEVCGPDRRQVRCR